VLTEAAVAKVMRPPLQQLVIWAAAAKMIVFSPLQRQPLTIIEAAAAKMERPTAKRLLLTKAASAKMVWLPLQQ
jgi:hypothetical protein